MQDRIAPWQQAATLLTDSQRLCFSYRNLVRALLAENQDLRRQNEELLRERAGDLLREEAGQCAESGS